MNFPLVLVAIGVMLAGSLAEETENSGGGNFERCPDQQLQTIIEKAADDHPGQIGAQMGEMTRAAAAAASGKWGVLVVTKPALVGTVVDWSIPVYHGPTFCIHVYKGVQYDLFQTTG